MRLIHFQGGGRGGQAVITPENAGNQVGNGTGMFVPTGSRTIISGTMDFYSDNTVDISLVIEGSGINTRGNYIVNYKITDGNGKIFDSGILSNNMLGIKPRFDFPTVGLGNYSVINTLSLRNIPQYSTLTFNIGLTYQIAAGAMGAIQTQHVIKIK